MRTDPSPAWPLFRTKSWARYAVERTDDYIKVWFWSRYDLAVPNEIRKGAGAVNPLLWVALQLHLSSDTRSLTTTLPGTPGCSLSVY